MKRNFFLILLQIVLWTAFIALPYFMVPHQSEETADAYTKLHAFPPDFAQTLLLSSLFFNICLILFFYFHHYFLFDRVLVKRRFATYISIIVGAFLLMFYTSHYVKKTFFANVPAIQHPITIKDYIVRATWFMLVLLVSLGLKLLTQWRQAEQRAQEIENEHLRTELSFLHAQINPHFLFNSLNTIYSLALKKSDTAPLAVIKLSELLRYVIDDTPKEKVPLEQEVNYLHNYIELQKLRSTSTLKVNFKTGGVLSSTFIAPMLLLPFVENSFKHGMSSHEESPIDIFLLADKEKIVFTVKNRNFEQKEKDSTGIGISNVRRRLELLYPNMHQLEIESSDDFYSIKLTIKFV